MSTNKGHGSKTEHTITHLVIDEELGVCGPSRAWPRIILTGCGRVVTLAARSDRYLKCRDRVTCRKCCAE